MNLQPETCETTDGVTRAVFKIDELRRYMEENPKVRVLWVKDSEGRERPIWVDSILSRADC